MPYSPLKVQNVNGFAYSRVTCPLRPFRQCKLEATSSRQSFTRTFIHISVFSLFPGDSDLHYVYCACKVIIGIQCSWLPTGCLLKSHLVALSFKCPQTTIGREEICFPFNIYLHYGIHFSILLIRQGRDIWTGNRLVHSRRRICPGDTCNPLVEKKRKTKNTIKMLLSGKTNIKGVSWWSEQGPIS